MELKITSEKRKAYNSQFYEKNKDKINSPIQCKCGLTYTYFNKSRHNKSKIHILVMEAIKKMEDMTTN
jgi:hypothetical protein